MKVAIVCDWLVGVGGAERVVLELHKMFPEAPIYTSQYKKDSRAREWFENADIRTLWLQKLPKPLRKFLPMLRMRAFSKLDLSYYDLVISSSGAEAKAVKTGSNTIHISYCHSPTHYYWSRYDEYMENPGFGLLSPVARLGLRLFSGPMRRKDWAAAQRPTHLVANSTHTQNQIKKYYGRESSVIYPPVDTSNFKPDKNLSRHGFIAAGRQTPYKRIDLAVAACSELNLPLIVLGNGPDHNKLVKMAGPRVTFLSQVSDEQMVSHFQRSEAFIFPNLDDFGIVAVEALATGTPGIAYGQGGAMDYVKPGKTGMLFDEQNVDSLISVLENYKFEDYRTSTLTREASKFKPEIFRQKMQDLIEKLAIPNN